MTRLMLLFAGGGDAVWLASTAAGLAVAVGAAGAVCVGGVGVAGCGGGGVGAAGCGARAGVSAAGAGGLPGHCEGGTITVAPKFGSADWRDGVAAVGAPQFWQKAFCSDTSAPHCVHVAMKGASASVGHCAQRGRAPLAINSLFAT